MSCKIPINSKKENDTGESYERDPSNVSTSNVSTSNVSTSNVSTYCYIKADKDHHDLQDLFDGKYIKSQEIWRFSKNLEQQVYNFLDCSSTESDEYKSDDEYIIIKKNKSKTHSKSDSDSETMLNHVQSENVVNKKKRRDRLHRANSFNASDDSNDECDSLDENFRRHRQPIEKLSVESNKLKKEANKY
jgi:hypothetical protein